MALLALALTVPFAPAQAPPAALEHEQVAVHLRKVATRFGGGSSQTGSGDAVLAPGERKAVYLAATPGLCSALAGGGSTFESLRADLGDWVQHLWWAEVELLASGLDNLRLRVDWERHDRRDGEFVRVNHGARELALEEGQRHMIDFIPEPRRDEGQLCYQNVLVEITAAVLEDPQLANEALRYDLWFVDDAPEGERTARLTAIGKQGEPVAFRFEPLRWEVGEDVFDDGADAHVVLEASAAIRGRLRRDGSIDVQLDATRWMGVAPEGEPRSGGIGDGGRKLFAVAPGESVKMVLPPPGSAASHGWRVSGAGRVVPPGRGIELTPDEFRVRWAEFFEGHEMSLLLTVTPV